MELRISVKAGSKSSSIQELSDGRLRVFVRAKAKDGKANDEVREALAARFDVLSEDVRIVQGASMPGKTVRIRGL